MTYQRDCDYSEYRGALKSGRTMKLGSRRRNMMEHMNLILTSIEERHFIEVSYACSSPKYFVFIMLLSSLLIKVSPSPAHGHLLVYEYIRILRVIIISFFIRVSCHAQRILLRLSLIFIDHIILCVNRINLVQKQTKMRQQ